MQEKPYFPMPGQKLRSQNSFYARLETQKYRLSVVHHSVESTYTLLERKHHSKSSTRCFPIRFGMRLSRSLDGNIVSLQTRCELAGTFCGICRLNPVVQHKLQC